MANDVRVRVSLDVTETPSLCNEVTDSLVEIFLTPGALYCTAVPSRVTTILGSCVAVCLWDARLRIGGVNHYLLPYQGDAAPSPRFGDAAIEQLLAEMLQLGCRAGALYAKVFGGAAVLGRATGGDPVGDQNVRVALEKLSRHGIPVIAQSTGGCAGMSIRLLTESGAVTVRRIATAAALDPAYRGQRWKRCG